MSRRTVNARHVIDTCTIHLQNWKPFDHHQTQTPNNKRPCLTETLQDISKLSLFQDEEGYPSSVKSLSRARKRRRRGSRSVSARSCSNAYGGPGTCSDFIMGTDSSGEMFNWGSDVSVDKGETLVLNVANFTGLCHSYVGNGCNGNVGESNNGNGNGNESGYGSEPGYRGDAELGYGGDEFDEEEDDQRVLFWGNNRFGDAQDMEIIGENTLQKAHHRCRRKKHELRMVDAV